ncbi:MAG: T9SS type A sorting domain-containing protein [Bacteroidetes bacterium]|nr:T9SS type A sorting domain-containing protein [Bacteroidota bacterium]
MKTTLLSIFTMAVALTQAQPAGLTVVKANAPYNEIKEVQGQLYGYYTYFSQPEVYRIDAATGNETLVGNVPLSVRMDGNLFQTNYFGFINGIAWSMSRDNSSNLKLWSFDASSIDSLAYFPNVDPIMDAEQVKDKAVVFLGRGIWSTDLTAAPVRIDDAVANWANHAVRVYDTIIYYTKLSTTKEYLCCTDGTTVRVLDSCSQTTGNISLTGYKGGEFYYCISPSQYGSVTIKKVTASGSVQTENTVGVTLYDNGVKNNSVITDDYILFRFYQQSPYVQNLYVYSFATSQLLQLTQFTTVQGPNITMYRNGINGNKVYVGVTGFGMGADAGTWVTDGTTAGTSFYYSKELNFYDKEAYYDLAHTAIVCADYPIAGIAIGNFPNEEKEYYFGDADGMHKVDISPVGNSVPQWFLKHDGAIYFTAYQNYVNMDTQKTNLYRVDACELAVGIEDAKAEIDISVFPNPSNGLFYVQHAANEDLNIEMYEPTGKLCNVQITKNGSAYVLNATGLAKGVYLVKATSSKGVTVKRVLLD